MRCEMRPRQVHHKHALLFKLAGHTTLALQLPSAHRSQTPLHGSISQTRTHKYTHVHTVICILYTPHTFTGTCSVNVWPYCVGNNVYSIAAKTTLGVPIQFQRVRPLTKLQHCPQIVLCTNPIQKSWSASKKSQTWTCRVTEVV